MNNLEEQCLRIRMIEEKISSIYASDKIQSPVHLSNGQEAVSVGVCAGLAEKDLVFGTYRGHALYLAKGGSLDKLMAELFGKETGCGGGRAGSMHLAEKEKGIMGCSAIVSSTIPHAVGAAYAAKLRNTGQVIACFFGEGAIGEGVYHESLNFASKHQLPILFVCENNEWAIFTRVTDVHAIEPCSHAKAYGVSSTLVKEGWDVKKVNVMARGVISKLREGEGPQLLEVQTFRYMEHVGPGTDIGEGPRKELAYQEWRKNDPLNLLLADARLVESIQTELAVAIEYAEQSPFPEGSDLLEDVY